MKDMMIWADVETTGLDATEDYILEFGLALTDKEGNKESELSLLVDWQDVFPTLEEVMDACVHVENKDNPTFVRDMHTKNGLFDDLRNGGKTFEEIYDSVEEWFNDNGIPKGKLPMTGSTVHFDKGFIDMHLTGVLDFFSHRVIDISSIKELCSLHNPRVAENRPRKTDDKIHRVQSCIEDSIAEYQFYLQEFLYVA